MQLTLEQLRDKIKGCWAGKNIGGVLGAPFEGYRQVNDVDFYAQQLNGNPPPNDDLDLQLVWLNAVEQCGRQVDARILGEYWLSYIVPHWVEYGTGKANMAMGIAPPLSGHVSNLYRESCGCFIRSELWACLAPGNPELAARYAYEDAIVDHAGDGMYGEIFCAALQSAAFVESDPNRLIDIALTYIPVDCKIAKAIQIAKEAYAEGAPFLEARSRIMTQVPGTFGLQLTKIKDVEEQFPTGTPGDDAANNIGLMIASWYYGEGDFAKSLCLAVKCGEDTDCTAATLGAVMGIILGYGKLPQKWLEPLNGVINTCSINLTSGIPIPQNIDELTERVLAAIPSFLGREYCDVLNGYTVKAQEGDALCCIREPEYVPLINGLNRPKGLLFQELLQLSPYAEKYTFNTFYAVADYMEEPYIKLNEPRKIKLRLFDNGLTRHQQWIRGRIYTSEGVSIVQGNTFSVPLQNTYLYEAVVEFDILAEQLREEKLELLIDLSVAGRHTFGVVKLVLLPRL